MRCSAMADWLLCRVHPEIYAAVERAAAEAYQQQSDWLRQAVIAKLRVEGCLPPRPMRRPAASARDREAA